MNAPGRTSGHVWTMWDVLPTLAEVAVNKPANSDVYTTHLAEFVQSVKAPRFHRPVRLI